ncbi:hypothetical protein P0W64_10875 [Tsukamurella sp. 8F]|uniref:hypothetical protein n=1 Tax=unclassified Tsukamurella TaxID=2633480 RepID=UPI0023B89BEA|nr:MULTISPECIES: hypothetical protein [unclassified Tsukamurella]MDF0529956.1 hypothetical protein [Tsukamurella sp. 8J]MDF0587272.1 hypothetical protein [Tsukamurella sp. 8F]
MSSSSVRPDLTTVVAHAASAPANPWTYEWMRVVVSAHWSASSPAWVHTVRRCTVTDAIRGPYVGEDASSAGIQGCRSIVSRRDLAYASSGVRQSPSTAGTRSTSEKISSPASCRSSSRLGTCQ